MSEGVAATFPPRVLKVSRVGGSLQWAKGVQTPPPPQFEHCCSVMDKKNSRHTTAMIKEVRMGKGGRDKRRKGED